MQLGTRWRFGETPPGRLSAAVVSALAVAERDAAHNATEAAGYVWTLTWLEGHAVCELDECTRVVQRADGSVGIESITDQNDFVGECPEDDWLIP
ncbi:hypothetical protein GCM10022198_04440 [Klugiella xanthotipulae]|uniref:Uncharacterized protein n=1 Tax=Klugiella xanthotipulae TaxID=244735 RepID=A0A543HSI7_9MICO|nr:hypothetical protein [Klugiella xanthotipulae]TQM61298.1 hypothetical protein FB466_2246 [Klugiella xanthotipulae]